MQFYRRIKPVRAISFDLDDTLYDNSPIVLRADRNLMTFLAKIYPPSANQDQRYWRKHRSIQLATNPALQSDVSELRRLTLLSGLRELGLQGPELHETAQQAFEYFYQQRSQFRLSQHIQQVLTTLAQRIPLVAITNGNVNLETVGIAHLFKVCFKANLNQPCKPHRCMFDLAAKHLDLPAAHILHVGDSLHNDIMGARQAGFSTAWHAQNRVMSLNRESCLLLPDLVLTDLNGLTKLTNP